MILPDVLKENLDVVFCGTAAGDKSAERKAYYAGRGNLFYHVLYISGFTKTLVQPEVFSNLLDYSIGLTDLAKYKHGMDNVLTKEDYDVESFEQKILKFQPKFICFNGKEAAKVFFEKKSTKEIELGLQINKLGITQFYVAPSTSFSARKYWDENVWIELNDILKREV